MVKTAFIFSLMTFLGCSSGETSSESSPIAFTLVSEDVNYREYLEPSRPWELFEAKMCVTSSRSINSSELETLYLSTVTLDRSESSRFYWFDSPYREILAEENGHLCLAQEVSRDGASWHDTPEKFRLEAKIRNVTTGEEFLIEGTKVFRKENITN